MEINDHYFFFYQLRIVFSIPLLGSATIYAMLSLDLAVL